LKRKKVFVRLRGRSHNILVNNKHENRSYHRIDRASFVI
jgi:hypothetical protein